MSSYKNQLAQILKNLILLYKNFLHWNISKTYVFVYANILGFILSLPFVGIITYQYFSSYKELGLASGPEEFILSNIGAIILTAVLLIIIVAIFICTYTYGNFLMMNVYKSYLKGEKLPYTKNLYFSLKHFRAYIGILGWISLYLLAPILIAVVLIFPLGLLAKAATGSITIVLAVISAIIFLSLAAWFFSLIIRLSFSYYSLLYSSDVLKSKAYIDESLSITKKKVWKIIFLVLPFLIIVGVIASLVRTGEDAFTKNRVYTALIEVQKQSGQDDHKLLEGFFVGRGILSNIEQDKEDFKEIEAAFEPMPNDVNKDFLSASFDYLGIKLLDTNGWIFTALFMAFSFLVFEGLTSMLFISVYNILLKRNEEETVKEGLK